MDGTETIKEKRCVSLAGRRRNISFDRTGGLMYLLLYPSNILVLSSTLCQQITDIFESGKIRPDA
jgi:hypothetical protein